jgi:hypothetical protein
VSARLIHEGPRYFWSLRAVGIRARSSQLQAIKATERALASAEVLPGPLDCEVHVSPVRRAWVRRVAGHNLWLYYRVREDGVYLLVVTREPPVPLDEDQG